MNNTRKLLIVVLLLGLALSMSGCKKKTQPVDTPAPPDPTPQVQDPAAPPPPETTPKTEVSDFGTVPVETADLPTDVEFQRWTQMGVLKTVYFGFDSYDLDDVGRAVLQANAEWLETEGARANIMVMGHCDERGTIEYNLALGERRASIVRDYLVSLGIDAFRIRIVSYGEEVPVDLGHTESAWAKNRRGEFDFES
jgi:peptidoglycan-associated lipoprotein